MTISLRVPHPQCSLLRLFPVLIVTVMFSLSFNSALAQGITVSGKLLDSVSKEPLIGATVKLTNVKDTTEILYTTSDANGSFLLSDLYPIDYRLTITFVGYKKWTKLLSLSNRPENLGTILMTPGIAALHEVKVTGRIPMAVQLGDTTQYNAKAFKTNPDATAGDLIKKIPGVTVQNGTVSAQGETVQKVLVDGKPYFGDDPTIALQNLPANIIDKIQIFDKLSDQAQFTGFDDGNSQKTINIVTLRNKRHSDFGKFYAGYGSNQRNSEGGNFNIFNGDQRISLIGLSNNINVQNFSTQDLLGVISSGNRRRRGMGMGMGRRMGGGPPGGGRGGFSPFSQVSNFLVGQQNGITSTHSVGINYNDDWSPKIRVNGSYFFNISGNSNNQSLNRTYFLQDNATQYYTEGNSSSSDNYNNRVNMRIVYNIDNSNSIIFVPKLSFQNFKSSNDISGLNYLSTTDSLSSTLNNYHTKNHGYDMSEELLLRHRFAKRGRTLSLNLQSDLQKNDGLSFQDTRDVFYQVISGNQNDTLNQQPILNAHGYNISSNLIYTEPVSYGSQLEIRVNTTYKQDNSDKETYNFNNMVNAYSLLDTTLSNTFNNNYLTNSGEVAYRHRTRGFFYTLGLAYQSASLINHQAYPFSNRLSKTFSSILPNAMLMYRISSNDNLRIFYRTMTNAPSINQLQNVVDNSNPLQLSSGNPDLKQETSNVLISRFSHTNVNRSSNIFALLYLRHTQNYITDNTIVATRDTTISGGSVLNQGSQYSQPVNLNGYWNLRTFLTYGFLVHFLQSNLNLTSGFNYTRTPGIINNISNLSNEYDFSEGLVLGSNISKKVDFTLSYTANIDRVVNQIQPELNNHYFYQTAQLNFSLTFWRGIVLRNDLTQQLYTGLSSSYNQTYYLWNMELAKKLFKNQHGEIAVSAYDILKQNNSISRTITSSYLEDQTNRVLSRYFLLTFTYKI